MHRKNIILDTDIGPDCDDVAALAVLNLLADRGLCRILGVSHCTSNPYGAGMIDVINRYYGRPDIAISTYGGKGFLTDETCMRYNRYIATHYPNRYQACQPEEAVGMYRRILAAQEDKSVEVIGIGPMNNLSDLLDSKPDGYSMLSGISLVERKVSKLTMMAGAFRCSSNEAVERAERMRKKRIEDMAEYNVECDIPAARNVAARWPTPKAYLGFEAGLILTGGRLYRCVPGTHPVRVAYELHGSSEGRFSWDPLTVEYAVVEGCPHFRESVRGTVRFDEKGRTRWKVDENGWDCFVELAQEDERVVADMDALLTSSPSGLGQAFATG